MILEGNKISNVLLEVSNNYLWITVIDKVLLKNSSVKSFKAKTIESLRHMLKFIFLNAEQTLREN